MSEKKKKWNERKRKPAVSKKEIAVDPSRAVGQDQGPVAADQEIAGVVPAAAPAIVVAARGLAAEITVDDDHDLAAVIAAGDPDQDLENAPEGLGHVIATGPGDLGHAPKGTF